MKNSEEITAFSQSEKIKSGIIWLSQLLEQAAGLPPGEKQGAEKIIRSLADMVCHEIRIAMGVAPDTAWDAAARHMDLAVVMIRSGVGPDAVPHLTQALSRVTGVGHRAMSTLKERDLI